MDLLKKLIFISLTLSAVPSLAAAGYSEAAVSSGGTMRVATLPANAQGVVSGMLDIDLLPGWITYWREPGATGIPPQITMASESAGMVSNVDYPIPKKIRLGEFLDIGYDAPVRIPFDVTLTDQNSNAPFEISVMIGVCNNICIPFMHVFTIDPAAATQAEAIKQDLAKARAHLPASPSADFKVDGFAIAANRTSVDLQLSVPEGVTSIEDVIIAGPSGHAYTLINSQKVEGSKALVNVDAISLPADYQTAGQQWHAVIRAGGRAIESELKF